MFVRVRQTPYGLQLSLVETRRIGGKVAYEHVAHLGSITTPASIADRVEFWSRLHQRLANCRLDAEIQAKVLAAVDATITMPSLDEQRALQLENTRTDARC
jgi:hypothetical protein